jgi:hypothetical protein
MKRCRWWLAAACCVALWLVASSSSAQPLEQAREVEAAAREAFANGEFSQAAERFAEAHRLVPSAMTKYNEAQSWYRAGDRAAAADAYEEALRMGTLDVALTGKCQKRLAELDGVLGVLVIATPEGARVSVEHARFRTVPTRIHLAPGAHAVDAITVGEIEHTREVQVVAGQTVHLAFPEDPATPDDTVILGEPREDPGEAQRIGGWVGVGLGGIAGIAAVALGASTLRAIGDFKETGNTDVARRAEAVKLRAWTNAAAVAGVVCGAVGFALVFTAPSDEVAAALVLSPTAGGVQLTW